MFTSSVLVMWMSRPNSGAMFTKEILAEPCSGCQMRRERRTMTTWLMWHHQGIVSVVEPTSTLQSPSGWRVISEAGSMLSLQWSDAGLTSQGNPPRDLSRRKLYETFPLDMLSNLLYILWLDLCTTCCFRNHLATTRMPLAFIPTPERIPLLHSLMP